MIVRQLINSALRKLGVYASGEGATSAEVSDALTQVNRMLYSWSSQANGIHEVKTESFSLVQGTQEYTYGSGGDFDSARPIRILRCWFRDNGVDLNILETTYKNFADIGDKDLESYPQVFLHNPEYPLAKVSFWPVPDDSYSVYFQAQKPLGQYTNSANDLNLPPEYEEAIEWNLAARLAPEYIGEVPRTVAMMAQQTFQTLKTLHAGPVPQINTSISRPTGRAYNIYEDE